MVKFRNANYCNLKLFLIFLVVYGHLIEPQTAYSQVAAAQYKGIYLFHMPLFCFLSGLFLHDADGCKQQLKKVLPLYLLCQGIAICFGAAPLIPYWHLWYLLSYSTWVGLGWLWFRFFQTKGRILLLVLSVPIGCLAGLCPYIGRTLSLSRSLVFLPYFGIGLLCSPQFHWGKLRLFSVFSLVAVVAGLALWGDNLPIAFLYQATPYGPVQNGILLRCFCYLAGTLLCIVFLAWMPSRRFPFTKIGADTMPAYLLHAPLVSVIRRADIPWPWHLLIATAMLYGIYRLLQWNSHLYGIIPRERRLGRCPLFRRSMKHTPSRSIDSC